MIEHCCDPVALGVNRRVTRTNPGGLMQLDGLTTTAKSGQDSLTDPQSVPPPEFITSKVRSWLCPTATVPKSRTVVETAATGRRHPGADRIESGTVRTHGDLGAGDGVPDLIRREAERELRGLPRQASRCCCSTRLRART